jgi:hypothetical protein
MQRVKRHQGSQLYGGKDTQLPPPPILLGGKQAQLLPRRNIQVSLQHNPSCASISAISGHVYCAVVGVSLIHHHNPHAWRQVAETSAKNHAKWPIFGGWVSDIARL